MINVEDHAAHCRMAREMILRRREVTFLSGRIVEKRILKIVQLSLGTRAGESFLLPSNYMDIAVGCRGDLEKGAMFWVVPNVKLTSNRKHTAEGVTHKGRS